MQVKYATILSQQLTLMLASKFWDVFKSVHDSANAKVFGNIYSE